MDGWSPGFSMIGCREASLPDPSATLAKEALMTDFELLSLVMSVISIVIIVLKK